MAEEFDKDGFDQYGRHRLHVAAADGNLEAVRKELEDGANIDISNRRYHDWTPLMCAARFGRAEVTKLLIERKADLNKTDFNGRTSLILAGIWNFPRVVHLLLAHKADTTVRAIDGSYKGKTALEIAKEQNFDGVVLVLENSDFFLALAKLKLDTYLNNFVGRGIKTLSMLHLLKSLDIAEILSNVSSVLSLSLTSGLPG